MFERIHEQPVGAVQPDGIVHTIVQSDGFVLAGSIVQPNGPDSGTASIAGGHVERWRVHVRVECHRCRNGFSAGEFVLLSSSHQPMNCIRCIP